MGLVKALVAGANFNAQNGHGNTTLHCAANTEVVKALIKAGADVNAKDKYGETPLHWSAKHANINVVRALVAADEDIYAKSKDGNTPINLAMEAKMKKFLKTEETIQFFQPIVIGVSTCFVTAAFKTALAAFLITKVDLPVELMPITLVVLPLQQLH